MAEEYKRVVENILLSGLVPVFGTVLLVFLCVRGCKRRGSERKPAEPADQNEVENGLGASKPLIGQEGPPKSGVVDQLQTPFVSIDASQTDSGFGTGQYTDDPGTDTVLKGEDIIVEGVRCEQTVLNKSGNNVEEQKLSNEVIYTLHNDELEFIDAESEEKSSTGKESLDKLDDDNDHSENKEETQTSKMNYDNKENTSEAVVQLDPNEHSDFNHGSTSARDSSLPFSPCSLFTVFQVTQRASSQGSLDLLTDDNHDAFAANDVTSQKNHVYQSESNEANMSQVKEVEELDSLEDEVTLKECFEAPEETEHQDEQNTTSVKSEEADSNVAEEAAVGGARKRSPTPDFDMLGRISFLDQAVLKFPSETHRGTVLRVPAQVQTSFEPREMQNMQHDEPVIAPNEDDNWQLLNSDRKKSLDRVFKQLIKNMGTNIPDFIQSMFKSDKWWRIYINIDKGCVSEAWDFLKGQCPQHAKEDLIQMVEQSSRPEFLSGSNIEGGMLMYALTEDIDLKRVLEDKNYFRQVKGTLPYVTLGAIICGKETPNSLKKFYALTVMHLLFNHFKYGKMDVNTVVTIPDREGTGEKVIHLGTEAHGIYGYRNINGSNNLIDILLIPINEEVLTHPALKRLLEVEEIQPDGQVRSRELKMEVFTGPEHEMENRMVQKKGGMTETTRGEVKAVDLVKMEQNRPLEGLIIIASRNSQDRPFAIVGDSGSVVRAHDDEVKESRCMAYALVHKVQNNLQVASRDKPEKIELYNLVYCVNLYNGFQAMKEMLHLYKLEFYHGPLPGEEASSGAGSRMAEIQHARPFPSRADSNVNREEHGRVPVVELDRDQLQRNPIV